MRPIYITRAAMIAAGFSRPWEQMSHTERMAAAAAALRNTGRIDQAMLIELNNPVAFSLIRIVN